MNEQNGWAGALVVGLGEEYALLLQSYGWHERYYSRLPPDSVLIQ